MEKLYSLKFKTSKQIDKRYFEFRLVGSNQIKYENREIFHLHE